MRSSERELSARQPTSTFGESAVRRIERSGRVFARAEGFSQQGRQQGFQSRLRLAHAVYFVHPGARPWFASRSSVAVRQLPCPHGRLDNTSNSGRRRIVRARLASSVAPRDSYCRRTSLVFTLSDRANVCDGVERVIEPLDLRGQPVARRAPPEGAIRAAAVPSLDQKFGSS